MRCRHARLAVQSGNNVIKGRANGTTFNIKVKCEVISVSFSAHATSNGIMLLATRLRAGAAVYVHGNMKEMEMLEKRMRKELKCDVAYPRNCERALFRTKPGGNANLVSLSMLGNLAGRPDDSICRLPKKGTLLNEDWESAANVSNLALPLDNFSLRGEPGKRNAVYVWATVPAQHHGARSIFALANRLTKKIPRCVSCFTSIPASVRRRQL